MKLTLEQLLIVIGAAVAFLAIVWLIIFVIRQKMERSGILGRKKVAKILRNFAGIRSYKVLNNITLPFNEKTTHIDHLLIGFFGIILLENRHERGDIYGDARTEQWISVVTNKNKNETRTKFRNPVQLNMEHTEALREIFKKENLYKIEIESYVLFTAKKVELASPPTLPVMKVKKFKALLSKSKYSADGPIDVKKTYDVIQKYTV